MSQENVEVAKAFYDAYNARNGEALDRLLHPEAEITTLRTRRSSARAPTSARETA